MCILIAGVVCLTGFLTHSRENRRTRPSAWLAVSLLCLALLALLAVAQVAHTHSVDNDADHCPLCVVMHSAAPVAVTAAVVVLVEVESAAPVFEPQSVTRPWHAQLFIRPPPASC
jgi:hypothetical protein